MKLPLKWLKEYIDYNVTHDEFVEKLMWRGFEVAEVIDEMPGIKNVVVCTVVSIEPHPDAKKLRVCRVDVGSGRILQIVTNSKVVEVGVQVPVALDGATLSDGLVIHDTVLRGVESFGMFCGAHELGLTEVELTGFVTDVKSEEVLIFSQKHPEGKTVQEVFELDSVIFDIELTPNRADCQSIIGMCREAAAALGQRFNEPVIKEVLAEGDIDNYAKVTIENGELCTRYCARMVTDLNIEPSPLWMQRKLRSVGLRPINNIVDITNYVLVEYGHPMHAFDVACVKDSHIVVRNAHEGEVVTTLDGQKRAVTPDMLLIADPEKGIGIAGVMGGENSEITEHTKAILFESAVFKGSSIRKTARKLRHTTDAATRFMKGVEPHNALLAVDRAIELVHELNAGRIIGGTIDVCMTDISSRFIDVSVAHVNQITSLDITAEHMCELLGTININASVKGDVIRVEVPHYRVDIESGIEADWDIAEEIARLYGYYNVEPTLMRGDTFCGRVHDEFMFEDTVKDRLVELGCCEMYNYNFTGPSEISALMLPENDRKRKTVHILNPFGEDQSLMRTTLIPGMLKTLSFNYSRRTGHYRFFEVGNVHYDRAVLPSQHKHLGIAFYEADEDFFTLKGAIEQLFEKLNIRDVKFVPGGGNYFQPGQKAEIYVGGERVGELGLVHPSVLKTFELPVKAYIAELELDLLIKPAEAKRTYEPLPRYPLVKRDIAIIVDDDMLSQTVVDAIYEVDTELMIENVQIFDVYKGTGIPEGKKSMAYSFTLRAMDHTLLDDEIVGCMQAILQNLEEKLSAKLR